VALKKTRLFNLNATGWVAEKAEGHGTDEYTLALTNDTDLGVSLAVLDASGKESKARMSPSAWWMLTARS
jgi:hypothetical protein